MTIRNFFGASGGVGTTTIVASHGVQLASAGVDTLLIDASDGALRLALAMPWIETSTLTDDHVYAVTPDLSIARADDDDVVAGLLRHRTTAHVAIDWGRRQPPLLEGERICVVTNDYGSLQRAVTDYRADAYVVSRYDSRRALSVTDVERALGKTPRVVLNDDATISRSIDAGLLTARLPRALDNQLQQLLLAPTHGG
jgi:hypothetical protein